MKAKTTFYGEKVEKKSAKQPKSSKKKSKK